MKYLSKYQNFFVGFKSNETQTKISSEASSVFRTAMEGYNSSSYAQFLSLKPENYLRSAADPDDVTESYKAPQESRSCEETKPEKKRGEKKVRGQRYAFQTRSQVDILDDGYRWRKYGQKAVKNNKFPRSYYRCTYQGCNVKKQVQRLTKDEGIVVTTYEGVHSHPIEKSTDNFEHILSQMQIYTTY